MAICIHIDKYKTIDECYVYHVTTTDRGAANFYMILNSFDKIIVFYLDEQLTKLIGVVYLNNPDEKIYIDGIDFSIAVRAVMQGGRAIRENLFPDHIGFYA